MRIVWSLIALLSLSAVGLAWWLGSDDEPSPPPARPPAEAGSLPDPSTSSNPSSSSPGDPTAPARAAFEQAATPESPAVLATVIGDAETAIRDPGTPGSALAAWAQAQQLAYRRLAANPAWDQPVKDALPELSSVIDANVRAHRELWSITDPRPSLPDWQIVTPPPSDELLEHYRAAQEEFGVPWEFLAAIHLVETRMGRIRGTSTAGAQGPMQFIPSTWEAYGEGDINDPADAIAAAGRYLAANGAPADMDSALFAYNRSDHYVTAVRDHAEVMTQDPRAYLGYYHWQVYYRLQTGDVLLPEGWTASDPPVDPGAS